MIKDERSGFVPVYKFAQDKGISEQNIYRWIREGKIKEEDFYYEEVMVRRLRVKKDLEIKKSR